jgi:hypothetical protein
MEELCNFLPMSLMCKFYQALDDSVLRPFVLIDFACKIFRDSLTYIEKDSYLVTMFKNIEYPYSLYLFVLTRRGRL